jgi:uncharacterized protein
MKSFHDSIKMRNGLGASGGIGSDLPSLVGVVIGFCSAPFLSAAYVAWMLKIRATLPEAFRFFRSAGRMSMTVYISESIVLACWQLRSWSG